MGEIVDGYDPGSRFSSNPICYAGEFYDNESGMIYLRGRYYDPETRRFITEDPAKDGWNWYTYCGNNPVMRVDPTGFVLQLEGTHDEINTIFAYLTELTRDVLYYEEVSDGVYQVSYDLISGTKYNVGTNLIRRIIDSNHTCNVSITYDGESGASPYDSSAAQTPGVGSGGTVNLSTNDTKAKVEGHIFKQTIPKYIELGHELIHVLRYMGGNSKSQDDPGGIWHNGDWVETASRDEYETTGIDYLTLFSKTFINANSWVTTENALRREHGLPERIRYNR